MWRYIKREIYVGYKTVYVEIYKNGDICGYKKRYIKMEIYVDIYKGICGDI